jgi:hypothetical protein
MNSNWENPIRKIPATTNLGKSARSMRIGLRSKVMTPKTSAAASTGRKAM